jgi:hypothetical protein
MRFPGLNHLGTNVLDVLYFVNSDHFSYKQVIIYECNYFSSAGRRVYHRNDWYLSGSVQETSYSFETPTHDREFHLIVRYMVPGQIIPLQNRPRQYSPNIYQNRPHFITEMLHMRMSYGGRKSVKLFDIDNVYADLTND